METVKFTELDIKPEILKAVANMGFEAMSPIQAKAIPVELSGKDVIGQAQTVHSGCYEWQRCHRTGADRNR